MSDSGIGKIANLVEHQLDATPSDPEIRARLRRQFVMAATTPAHRVKRTTLFIAAAAVLAITIPVLLWLQPTASGSLATKAANQAHTQPAAPVADNVATDRSTGPTPIDARGGHFQPGPQSRARLIKSTPSEVVVLLEQGHLTCAVNGNHQTRYRVVAGQMAVTVMGTRFEVDWQPQSETGKVTVHRGLVAVSGPGIEASPLLLAKGDQVIVAPTGAHVTRTRQDSDPTDQAHARQITPAQKSHLASRRANAPTGDRIDCEKMWQQARQARKTRQKGRAITLFQDLLTQCPHHPLASQATFMAGRVAMEIDHHPDLARTFFEGYLKKWPTGPLAEPALSRMLDICIDGHKPCANQTAQRYLSDFPDGPRQKTARQLLNDTANR